MAILQSMRALVERNERLHGDERHLIYGEQRRTFRQFAERARRLASGPIGSAFVIRTGWRSWR